MRSIDLPNNVDPSNILLHIKVNNNDKVIVYFQMAWVITFYLFILFLGIFNSIFCNKMQYSSLTLFV